MKAISIILILLVAGMRQPPRMEKGAGETLMDSCLEETYTSHPMNNWYRKELNDYLESNGLPGAVIAIKKQDQAVWIGAAGKSHVDNGTPMQVCTPFRIGSITKVFIAAIVLQLKEAGKLDLDDKLVEYLPDLKDKVPQAGEISIRMLLNHTNGIIDPKNGDSAYLAHITHDPARMDSMSIDERLERYVYKRPLLFTPGTQSQYSNTGYWLLGKVIERITKKTMQEVLYRMVFQPLKMKNSYYDERINEKVAHGYFVVEGNLTDVTKWDKADGDGDPSSGIVSTADELLTFGEALFSGRLITRQSLQEMLTVAKLPACPGGECEYGLGIEKWDVVDAKGYGKNGSSIGYDVNWIYIPGKKMTLITFANKGGGTEKTFIERVLK